MNKIIPKAFRNEILALAGASMFTLTACNRGPLHQIDNNPDILSYVDTYTKSEINNPDTKNLDLFKIDTIEIDKNNLQDFNNFNKNLTILAKRENPQILVDERWEYGHVVGPHVSLRGITGKSGFDYHQVQEYANKYIDSTIVTKAQNKVFVNKNETKFYIPIEYYGKADTTYID